MSDFKYLKVTNKKDLKLLIMQLIFLGYEWHPRLGTLSIEKLTEHIDDIRIEGEGYIVISPRAKNITGYIDKYPGRYSITIETTIEELTE